MSQIHAPMLPDSFDSIPGRPEDFLSPQQRLEAIADILAEMTLQALQSDPSSHQTP